LDVVAILNENFGRKYKEHQMTEVHREFLLNLLYES